MSGAFSGIPSLIESSVFRGFKREPVYLIGGNIVKVDGQDRTVETLTEIEGGVVFIPNDQIGEHQTGLTPSGERTVTSWMFTCHKTVTLKQSSVLKDGAGHKYTVSILHDYADHYQGILLES